MAEKLHEILLRKISKGKQIMMAHDEVLYEQEFSSRLKEIFTGQGPYRQFYREKPPSGLSPFFITDLWFGIVEHVKASQDILQERYGHKSWTQEFLEEFDLDYSSPSVDFKSARSALDLDPDDFIVTLEGFAKNLFIQEVTGALMRSITLYDAKNEDFGMTRCWFEVQSMIERNREFDFKTEKADEKELLQKMSLQSDYSKAKMHELKQMIDDTPTLTWDRRRSAKGEMAAARHYAKFLDRNLARMESSELTSTRKKAYVERLERLNERFTFLFYGQGGQSNELSDYRRLSVPKLLPEPVATLSFCLRDIVHARPVSTHYFRFEQNVCRFCTMVTGKTDLDYENAFQVLRDHLTQRKQQWAPLYDQISRQRAELEKQQQIITCLSFRHLLEMLPDANQTLSMFSGVGTNYGATGIWKLSWQIAVEQQIIIMLHEKVFPTTLTVSGISIPSPPTDTEKKSKILRELLQHDLGYWISSLKTIKGTGKTKLTANDVLILAEYQKLPPAIRGIGPPTSPTPLAAASSSSKKSTYENLFTTLGLDYTPWNGYQRGLNLYSELSGSIHNYDKAYKIDENNWAKSDQLVLLWLKPQLKEDDPEELVDWKKARGILGLPFTP